jgi:arylsulfatase
VQEWSSLSTDEQRLFARYMEVFAGFVSHTDAQIGRVLQYLDDNDLRDNTIVLLMSDNGASSEGGVHGTLTEAASWLGDFASVQDALEHIDEIGGPLHTNHYPFGWAWSGNSPFQLWKRYSWLGGVRAPLIVRWPHRIADAGAIRSQFIHAVDIALLKSALTQSVNVMRWPVELVLLHVPRHQVDRNQRVLEIPAMR